MRAISDGDLPARRHAARRTAGRPVRAIADVPADQAGAQVVAWRPVRRGAAVRPGINAINVAKNIKAVNDGQVPPQLTALTKYRTYARHMSDAVVERNTTCNQDLYWARRNLSVSILQRNVIGSQRTATIRYMEPSDGHLLLQGTELGYGWSIAFDTKTGAIGTTLVNREDVFVLFGACPPSRARSASPMLTQISWCLIIVR
jgi:hypothetical protein